MISIQKKYLKEIRRIRKERDAYYKKSDADIEKLAKQIGLSSEEEMEIFWSFVINDDEYAVQVVSGKWITFLYSSISTRL